MVKVSCYVGMNRNVKLEFETNCIPKEGEKININGDIYVVTDLIHDFEDSVSKIHKAILILNNCNFSSKNNDECICNGASTYTNNLSIDINGDKMNFKDGGFRHTFLDELKINYCPMCGKQLKK